MKQRLKAKWLTLLFTVTIFVSTIFSGTSLQAQQIRECSFIPRSGTIAPSEQIVLRLPVKDDIQTENGISSIVLIGDEQTITAHLFVQTSPTDAWKGSQYLVAVKQTTYNGNAVISFEENVHHSELGHKYLLVIVVPKSLANNILIQPFNNVNKKHFNTLIVYNAKNTRNGVISAFDELKTAKNHHEYLSQEMNQLLINNLEMGQILVPNLNSMPDSIIPPLIQETSFCSNYL